MACFRPPNARPAATPGSPPCAPYSSSSPENSTSPGSTRRPHSPLEIQKSRKWTIEIIKRSDVAKGFEVLPRRWVVERTLAWLSRNRRLAKDFEQTIASASAWLFVASVQLFTRRIARHCNSSE
ncbi:hypothetical protein BAL199_13760 [alpha proteobacterium BAL199]|nr:hypothetical protein BAL199_13760 [alpha proteobacterium BAL199]